MEADKRKIEYYITATLKEPFVEWFNSLKDIRARAIIRARVERVRFGNFGDCEPVGSGISELKINYGPGYRIYFGQVKRKVIILLCGGDKDTQRRDIKKAKEYWSDFKRRTNDQD